MDRQIGMLNGLTEPALIKMVADELDTRTVQIYGRIQGDESKRLELAALLWAASSPPADLADWLDQYAADPRTEVSALHDYIAGNSGLRSWFIYSLNREIDRFAPINNPAAAIDAIEADLKTKEAPES